MTEASTVHAFARYLEELGKRDDSRGRAALAALRRGLGKPPGAAPEMFPYLVPWTSSLPERMQSNYYLVASLYAVHPGSWPTREDEAPYDRWRRNLGASMRWVAEGNGELVYNPVIESATKSTSLTATERRFVTLLNRDWQDLHEPLRHAVRLCHSKDVPIDWGGLLRDLLQWDGPEHHVQRAWARGFWSRPVQAPSESDHTTATEGE